MEKATLGAYARFRVFDNINVLVMGPVIPH